MSDEPPFKIARPRGQKFEGELNSVDVLICGAGPAGLTVANLLGSYGVSCVVCDRAKKPNMQPRAILIDDESLRTLQAVGLDREFQPLIRRGMGARYYDEHGEPFAEVGPGPQTFGFPKRSHFFQPDLEAVLLKGLDRYPGCRVAFDHELVFFADQDESGVTCHVATPDRGLAPVRASFVLACDGARSPIRERLGIEMEGENYGEDWVIFDCDNDPDQEPVSKFHCRVDRPYVSVVGPRGGRRYEFRARPGDTPRSLRDPANVRALLGTVRQGGDDGDITRVAVYRFEAKLAARWREGRIFLLGDAAHLTPPFAGQGMNAGIRDAHNLAWKLAACLGRFGGASVPLLDTYEAERRVPAWAMVQLAVAMGEVVMPEDRVAIDFRSRVIGLMSRFPAARDYIVGMKFKPPPMYMTGAFAGLDSTSHDADRFVGSLVGHMLPQPPVRWTDQPEVSVREPGGGGGGPKGDEASRPEPRLDSLMGCGFALLVQSEAAARAALSARDQLWPELAPQTVVLGDGLPAVLGGVRTARPDWADEHAALPMAALRAHRDQLLLVRPDRFVAAALWPDRPASVRATVANFRASLRASPPARL